MIVPDTVLNYSHSPKSLHGSEMTLLVVFYEMNLPPMIVLKTWPCLFSAMHRKNEKMNDWLFLMKKNRIMYTLT